MNELDQFAKYKLKVEFYIRYVDDFIVISENRQYLCSLIEPIEDFLRQGLKLDLHPVKRKIFSSRSGIDFLGYFIRRYYKTLRFGNVKRLLRRIAEYKKDGECSVRKQVSMAAWMGYAKQADTYNLRENLSRLVMV